MSTKGLIWVHTNEHRKLIDISQLQQYELNGYSRGSNAKVKHSHKHSIATRVHLSNVLRGKTGGYHIGSGKGIKGYYKGIYCSSSWELAFVIYHIEHCLNIKQCAEVRTYEFNGKCHKYHPDFVTDVGIFEIKGIKLDDKTRAKLAANPDVILIDRNSIWDPYLSYVVNKYGWGLQIYMTLNQKLRYSDNNLRHYIGEHLLITLNHVQYCNHLCMCKNTMQFMI